MFLPSIRIRSAIAFIPIILVIAAAIPLTASADLWSIDLQNDIVTGTDEHYTNGISVNWISDPVEGCDDLSVDTGGGCGIFNLFSAFSLVNEESEHIAVGYRIAQDVYTPSNTRTEELITNDIPYAGYLHARYSLFEWRDQIVSSSYFSIGLVGPLSGAEWAQKSLHRLIGNEEPMGWEHQLQNQPILGFGYSRSIRSWSTRFENGTQLDWINSFGFEVGNFMTGCSVGSLVRYGVGYPLELGPDSGMGGATGNGRIAFGSRDGSMGWSLNLGTYLSGVAYSMILDSSDEHDLDRKPYIHAGIISISFFISDFEFTFSIHSIRTLTNDVIQAINWGSLSFSLLT